MVWFTISFLLFLAHIVNAADGPCIFKSPCKCELDSTHVIDLTTDGNHNPPLFYDVVLESAEKSCNYTELYSYNPCFAFNKTAEHTRVIPDHEACVEVAGCVTVPAGGEGDLGEQYAIGLQKTAVFGMDKEENMYYINYTANGAKSGSKIIMKVNLICDTTNVKPTLALITPDCRKDEVVLNFTSKCACPNGCSPTSTTTLSPSQSPTPTTPPAKPSPGMSTGSKLLIAFFTILLGYLLIGVLWNFCNGAQGAELVPNLAFWTDLPTLMMEGVTFTCSCCSSRSTYGEV